MPHEFNTQTLLLLQELDEQFIAHQRRVEASTGEAHPCVPGCAACCYGPFDVSRSDLLLLLEAVSGLETGLRRAVLERIRDAAARQRAVLDLDARDPVELDAIGEEAFDAMCDALADAPCPFLDEVSQTCVAHAMRPQPCRLRGAQWALEGDVLDFSCPIDLTEGHPVVSTDVLDLNDRLARLEVRAHVEGLPADRTTIALGLDRLLRTGAG